ncbi:TIGR04211 family SH3 domain-containing protein [Psychromonas algicola]|uniref:TIGR04211 family SH3 domain-containing protein n=1 Tax=Psychromonas algicola TaxID=2555642 RepID=UPI001FBA7B55|nr:TIGR04211 family SH3 domain-containing protein [Psychromonas sp. RZ5]
MKSIKLLLCLIFSSSSFAATQYVTDNLTIFMHSGPSLEYRIIGALAVGTDVNALEYNEETKFMQVKTNAGKTGWVKLSELQQQPPANVLLPKIQKELAAAKNTLKRANNSHEQTVSNKDQEIIDKDKLIARLRLEKKALEESVAELEALNVEFDILKETKESRMMMEWLMYGGSILFFGILFGLILPFLPRRKKSNSGW